MNQWFYRNEDQPVGPFDREVLDRLKAAGVIHDRTSVKSAREDVWCAFSELPAGDENKRAASAIAPDVQAARFFYLDTERRPVGPFPREALQRLHDEGVITTATLVCGQGDADWMSVGQFLGARIERTALKNDVQKEAPKHRSFEHFALMMTITLTFYVFYLVPVNSHDMKTITGRARMEFTPLLFCGILTFGLLIVIMLSLWAYDLEKHGAANGTPGRQVSLGTYVLALNVLSIVVAFFSGGLAVILSGVFTAGSVWLFEKEINLYAKALPA